ncbi:transporter substrate-binding domain-containing protein [Siculibacillus lacustris]|uniref:Transporter substrate-binding domain-containing protein n=1 Tax=Siculibacillus lacustris TaxID=1549641 RepID=A0A4Q9VYM1_9HYPH|nr:transporter substrate-binding domain-containing protein [Siculibacillus lacustris]TBW40303.1 transporter substrate-binding domain-containing protein [Siculibacillus lacustris]
MSAFARFAFALAAAVVVAVPGAGGPGPVLAQEAPAARPTRLDEILARGVLKVGTTGDYRPFTSLDKATGRFEGYDIDVAEALGAALGVKVEFVATSWPKLMDDFVADRFDIAMGGVSITLPRQKKGFFSIPIMREGKTPIARCGEVAKFQTIADLDKPTTHVVVNPGGTNEAFAKANLPHADLRVHPDNTTIFEEVAAGRADVMVTDTSETLYQQKLHPGVLCSVHPDKPFDFAEKAYWLQRDVALKAFVDQFLHISAETGRTRAIAAKYFD